MKLLRETTMFRPSQVSKGTLDSWKELRVFPRAIDGYAFAAAFAIRERFPIEDVKITKRTDLYEVGALEIKIRRSLEAGVHAARKSAGLPAAASDEEVFELVSRYAEIGVAHLNERWKGKSKSQILEDIRELVAPDRTGGASGPGTSRISQGDGPPTASPA